MNTNVTGLHHITAIASDPRQNLDFYTKVLGLRFVKKSVNQDDPGTYHLYYGDYAASPGTILTFFPWAGLRRGRSPKLSVMAMVAVALLAPLRRRGRKARALKAAKAR